VCCTVVAVTLRTTAVNANTLRSHISLHKPLHYALLEKVQHSVRTQSVNWCQLTRLGASAAASARYASGSLVASAVVVAAVVAAVASSSRSISAESLSATAAVLSAFLLAAL
jgi:hypothetical protein